MTKLLDPNETVRFVPADQKTRPKGEQIAYLFRVPRLYDGPALARAIAAAGGVEPGVLELIRALRADIPDMWPSDDDPDLRAAVIAAIDDYDARVTAFHEQLRDGAFDMETEAGQAAFVAAQAEALDGGRLVRQAEQQAHRAGGRYSALQGYAASYAMIAGIESARLLLVGWENLGDFRRTTAGVPDDLLERVPKQHWAAIAAEVERLSRLTEAERKNSGSRASTSPAPSPSSAKSRPPQSTPCAPKTAAPDGALLN